MPRGGGEGVSEQQRASPSPRHPGPWQDSDLDLGLGGEEIKLQSPVDSGLGSPGRSLVLLKATGSPGGM